MNAIGSHEFSHDAVPASEEERALRALPHQSRIGMTCPHCGCASRIRSSRLLTVTYRQLTIQCRNALCGHTFGAELTVTHTISPSACPNPSIHLRMVPPRRLGEQSNPSTAPPEQPG